ncbi:hypothetical protein A2U01_0080605, partial [Trifolium medium]|nr:hypothetical protein [Trifolium medium]
MPHPALGPALHQSQPAAVVDDEPDTPDYIHPEHGSDALPVSWSASKNAQTGQSAGGTAGSRSGSGPELCSPEQQPSVGESS